MDKFSKTTISELLRYLVAGGTAAVCDIVANYACLNWILHETKDNAFAVIVSVAFGFIVGTIVNYVLSTFFVFNNQEQQKRGKTIKGFFMSALVGLIGLAFAEGITLLGTKIINNEGIAYIMLTCVVKGIVFIWNYIGRKIFVYKS